MRFSDCRTGSLVFLLALVFLAASSPVMAAEEGAAAKVVVATVGGKAITQGDLDRFIEQLPDNIRPYALTRKGEILQSLIHRRLMFRHAEDTGLAKTDRVKGELAKARREILIREAVRVVEEKAKPTSSELRSAYDGDKSKYKVGEKVTASHIMVASEKEAQALIVELKKGTEFAALAKQHSLAPERERGGSLGDMVRGDHKVTGLPAIIEETAFSLEPGTYSGVVKSVYGWHVVFTSKKDAGKQLSFEEARPKIEEELGEKKQREAVRAALKELAAKYKVESFPDRVK